MYQRKSGHRTTFDEECVVPTEDFKACLKAFSIKLGDKDLKKYEKVMEEVPHQVRQRNAFIQLGSAFTTTPT